MESMKYRFKQNLELIPNNKVYDFVDRITKQMVIKQRHYIC